ncbi:MAG: hypothetical protein HY578_02660 [Nitrospinae bacterium]|nr:hypothetical protein [Nitrospinota bacterium]
MGVFHLSGLGLNPGAVTVPLTYIYFLLKQSKEGDPASQQFFAYSGEKQERLKGKPEALIFFTSKEVITGKFQREISDELFRTKKQGSACLTISEYISNMIKSLRLSNDLYGRYGVKYLYAIEVNINDFGDCYKKIYLTMKGLEDKEIECNLIGGTNQINLSLMLAGSMTGVTSRLYYVFEKEEDVRKGGMGPVSITSTNQQLSVPPSNWYEMPPLFVSLGDLIKGLEGLGITYSPVNIEQVKGLLRKLNLQEQFLAKLRGTWLTLESDRAEAGPLLRDIFKLHKGLEEETQNVKNFSEWSRYFEEKKYLHKFIKDGKQV